MVRAEIKRRLNKDTDSDIGELSDPFIRWLQEGIAAMGSQAVDRQVTLSWVRVRLMEHSEGSNEGLLGGGSYAFFDAPDGFFARIGPAADTALRLHLRFRGLRWRVSSVYYMLNEEKIELFERTWECNLGVTLEQMGRFRVNVFRQRGEPAMVIRHLKHEIPSIEALTDAPIDSKLHAQLRGAEVGLLV